MNTPTELKLVACKRCNQLVIKSERRAGLCADCNHAPAGRKKRKKR